MKNIIHCLFYYNCTILIFIVFFSGKAEELKECFSPDETQK